ncbi:toll/interleukin-1 receptor domain-containing protein [Photobacterium damselae]|uniref:toll/interleukin-1 receptor domain-containing protein n=1 Tax=Photobacterium damselae TaxID=38293 RepID=UPI00370B5EA2
MFLYELAILGDPSTEQIEELELCISYAIAEFGFKLGEEVSLSVNPENFEPSKVRASAAIFYGSENASVFNVQSLINQNIPILPVVSDYTKVNSEIPICLRHLNCILYEKSSMQRITSSFLECVGLLPKQRKVFISYRRCESRQAALQLFEALSARHFDVFLDSHGIPPAEDFQSSLWQQLCESDVLLMLDTQSYFDSRWTYQEYGRTQSKNIPILRIGWPGVTRSDRTRTAHNYELDVGDIDLHGNLSDISIDKICEMLEVERSKGYAVRSSSMLNKLREQLRIIDASILGLGYQHSVSIRLPNQVDLTAFPVIGVPNAKTLQYADEITSSKPFAIIYDCIGIQTEYQKHIDWLNCNFESARWIQIDRTSWELPAWEVAK